MQNLSHATRAYIFNANCLPGFLSKLDIMQLLIDADNQKQLEHVKRYQ